MATTFTKKPTGKRAKSIIEQVDAPIQFGVPSEPVAGDAVADGPAEVTVINATTADVTGDALSMPELADALDMEVEAVMETAVEPVVEVVAATFDQMPDTMTAAAIAPVELEIAPVDVSRVEAAPVTEPEHKSNATQPTQPTKDQTMDETTNTTATMTNGAAGMMNGAAETMKTAASDMQSRGAAMMGDMSGRAKSAMERGTKAVEELVEFQKGNLEAMMTSGRVATNGAQDIAKYSAEYGRATIEKANANARQFAAVKSPTEFFQLQGEIAKQMLDGMVAEGAKFTESYMKLVGEVSQPLSNRVAVAVDKAKTTMGNQG